MKQKTTAINVSQSKASGAGPAAAKKPDSTASASGAALPKPQRLVKDSATLHNREVQLNATSDKYWKARGFEIRPDDWERRLQATGGKRS